MERGEVGASGTPRVATGPRAGQAGFRNISLKVTSMHNSNNRCFSLVSSKCFPASTKGLTSLPVCKEPSKRKAFTLQNSVAVCRWAGTPQSSNAQCGALGRSLTRRPCPEQMFSPSFLSLPLGHLTPATLSRGGRIRNSPGGARVLGREEPWAGQMLHLSPGCLCSWAHSLSLAHSFPFLFLFAPAPAAYGSSQARDGIRTGNCSCGLRHSHGNTGSEPHLGGILNSLSKARD